MRSIPTGTVDEAVSSEAASTSRVAAWADMAMMAGLLALLLIVSFHRFSFQVAVGGVLALFLLWSIKASFERRIVLVWSPIHWILLMILAVSLLQLAPVPFLPERWHLDLSFEGLPVQLTEWPFITFDKQTTTRATIALAALIGYLIIAVNATESRERLRLLVNWLIGVGFAVAVLSILNRFSSDRHAIRIEAWPAGFMLLDPGYVYVGLLTMLLPLPLGLIFARGARRDHAILYGFAAVVMGIALATSQRSGGIFVLVLEVLVLAVLVLSQRGRIGGARRGRSRKGWDLLGVVVIAAGIVAGVIWTAARPVSREVSSDVTRELQGIEALDGELAARAGDTRLLIWKTTMRLIIDHPLTGVGLGAFPTAYTRYDPTSGYRIRMNAAHNEYLQLLSETGLVGGVLLVFFLIFLVRLSKKGLQSRAALGQSVALGASVGCFGILVYSLVDLYLQQAFINSLVFFVLIALLLIVRRLDRHLAARGPI